MSYQRPGSIAGAVGLVILAIGFRHLIKSRRNIFSYDDDTAEVVKSRASKPNAHAGILSPQVMENEAQVHGRPVQQQTGPIQAANVGSVASFKNNTKTTQHDPNLITASSNATNATTINKLTNATSQHKVDLTAFVPSKDSMLAEAETITGLTAPKHDRDDPSDSTTPEPSDDIHFGSASWSDFWEQHKSACIITASVFLWFAFGTTWAAWGYVCQSELFDRLMPAVYDGKGTYVCFTLKYMIFFLVFFPVYFWHAYWDWPKRSALEPTVRNHLQNKKHIFSESVINMICYRRNMLLMSFLFSFCMIALHIEDFVNTFVDTAEYAEWKEEIRPLNYSKFAAKEGLEETDPEAFMKFSMQALQAMGRESRATTTTWHQVGDGIGTVVAMVTTMTLGHALNFWDEFRSQLTQTAWFISIFGPFLATVVPVKFFINTEGVNAMAHEYDAELQRFSNQQTEYYAKQALDACQKLSDFRTSGFLDTGVETMQSVCDSIRRYTPNTHFRCCKPLFNILDAPFNMMHSSCQLVDEYLSKGNVDQARDALRMAEEDICMAMNADLTTMAEGEKSATSHIMTNNVVAKLVKYMSMYETAITTGLMCFSTIIVPALAIAQGLLRAAWAAKLIVPMSSLPGFLILILPWLFCPFQWGICTMLYQFEMSDTEGQLVFYIGLIICVASGFWMTFGGLWIQIQKPMNDSQAEDAYIKLSFGVIILYGIGSCCVMYFAVIWIKSQAASHFDSTDVFDLASLLSQYYVARPQAIFFMAVAYFNDFFLTQLAATDFLSSCIAQQWAYDMESDQLELDAAEKDHLLSKVKKPSTDDDAVGVFEELSEETAIRNAVSRVERLDCLLYVDDNTMEHVVKDAESGSRVKLRQIYLPEGGAYQYKSDGFGGREASWQHEGDSESPSRITGDGNSRIAAQSGGGAYGQYQQSGGGYGAYGQYQQSGGGYHDPYAQPAEPQAPSTYGQSTYGQSTYGQYD